MDSSSISLQSPRDVAASHWAVTGQSASRDHNEFENAHTCGTEIGGDCTHREANEPPSHTYKIHAKLLVVSFYCLLGWFRGSFDLLSCGCFILWYFRYCLLCVLFQLRTQHLHILCDSGNVKKYHACLLIIHALMLVSQ